MLTMMILATAGWKLVWSDEFEKAGLPDPQKWTYEVGFIRNNELQYYTVGDQKNARVENGNLVIECRKDPKAGNPITSASMITLGKADWLYGRVEVRAKVPAGLGSWPAIWMMGTDRPKVGWPKCGEIDIMEFVGHNPDKIHATVHFPANEPGKLNASRGSNITTLNPWSDFHVYAVEWSRDRLDFYYDEKMYFSVKNDGSETAGFRFDKPCYLLINLAFGGTWGAQKGVDESVLPLKYLVDYVRIYQRK
jgi:beta-glucanase (GH16 family)